MASGGLGWPWRAGSPATPAEHQDWNWEDARGPPPRNRALLGGVSYSVEPFPHCNLFKSALDTRVVDKKEKKIVTEKKVSILKV